MKLLAKGWVDTKDLQGMTEAHEYCKIHKVREAKTHTIGFGYFVQCSTTSRNLIESFSAFEIPDAILISFKCCYYGFCCFPAYNKTHVVKHVSVYVL